MEEVSEARALGMKTVLKTSRFPPASVSPNRSATFTGASVAADTANASAEATPRVFASTSVSSSAIPETRPAEDVASLAASSSRHSARDRTRRPLGVAVRSARDAATDADEDAALGRRARGGRADAAAVAAAAAHDATIDMVAWRRGSLCAGKSTTFGGDDTYRSRDRLRATDKIHHLAPLQRGRAPAHARTRKRTSRC